MTTAACVFYSSFLTCILTFPLYADSTSEVGSKERALIKMQKQAALVRKQHAKHLADIQSGKIHPHQRFIDAYPLLSKKIPQFQLLKQDWRKAVANNETEKANRLAQQLLKGLQPVGIWLPIADYDRNFDGKLSAAEQAELKRLEQAPDRMPANLKTSSKKLSHTQKLASWHTIQYLPVPLSLNAPAGAKVFLQSTAGGEFENGLSIIEKKANDKGEVTCQWVSRGDTIALSQVKVVSPACSNILYFNMNVKKLGINFPANLDAQSIQQFLKK